MANKKRNTLKNYVVPSKAAVSKAAGVRGGVLSIVNTPNNGKRLSLSPALIRELGNPETLQVAFGKKKIAFAWELPDNEVDFNLKHTENGTKYYIYATGLVDQITDFYNLDFSDRTTHTFSRVTFKKINGLMTAFVRIID